MSGEDEFEPRLGRMRAGGKGSGRKFLHRVLAAANLARGGGAVARRSGSFSGARIGRGAGVGRVLATRDVHAAFRRRRVVIKSRIVKLTGKGAAAAGAHLRYIERDGTTREGARGELYGAEADRVDGKAFLERGAGDRHQFRFIVSAEDGAAYADLKPLTRRLMSQVEADLGTRLDWVAVDHFNTGHPHTHILVRGADEKGRDLVIARDYLTVGMRERAAELVDLDLGPRSDREIEAMRRREIEQERLTGIDRMLIREAETKPLVVSTDPDPFEQSLRIGRLRKLERMGLATQMGAVDWRLAPDLAETLKAMGERGDIIRTMQRAFTAHGQAPALGDHAIYDPAARDARALVGRIVERGLSDELQDRHYLIVEATDGRAYYVGIGKGEAVEPQATGAIVRIVPAAAVIREADRTVADVAAANGGRYDVDAHLRHDPAASEAFAQAHVRRLEAIRRLTGGVTREADGSWRIAQDHLDRAAAYETARTRDRPVTIETLSPVALDKLDRADAATWLDRELVAAAPEPLRDAGFGAEVRAARMRRLQWLVDNGFADRSGNEVTFRPGMIAALRQREIVRLGAQLSRELGLHFVETRPGTRVEGNYRRSVDTLSGRMAVIERARDFTLVPWRSVLERQVGRTVSGILRSDVIDWSVGRGRGGPSIS